jgi:hypothetical protein
MKVSYWRSEGWPGTGSYELAGISVREAEKHLKEKGGAAFTAFFNREGELLETREIAPEGGGARAIQEAGDDLSMG